MMDLVADTITLHSNNLYCISLNINVIEKRYKQMLYMNMTVLLDVGYKRRWTCTELLEVFLLITSEILVKILPTLELWKEDERGTHPKRLWLWNTFTAFRHNKGEAER